MYLNGEAVKLLTVEKLLELRKENQDKIDGPENDGRTTSDGSFNLDMWMDNVETIDNEISRREKKL